jgi:hypothetical protein
MMMVKSLEGNFVLSLAAAAGTEQIGRLTVVAAHASLEDYPFWLHFLAPASSPPAPL